MIRIYYRKQTIFRDTPLFVDVDGVDLRDLARWHKADLGPFRESALRKTKVGHTQNSKHNVYSKRQAQETRTGDVPHVSYT